MRQIVLCFVLCCVAAPVAAAQANESVEYKVKAAFLFNFIKFVEWPESDEQREAPYVLGILGKDPFGRDLDETLAGQIAHDRPLRIVRLTHRDDLKQCHILFISPSEKAQWPQIVQRLAGAPVLTVSEFDGFAESGGMINFIVRENRVRFQINHQAAQAAGLRISSKLLRIADVVPTRR